MNEVVIIGSGPAGWTAAIYAARAGLDPLVVSGLEVGGQMTITTDVDNYPGFKDTVQGPELMEAMQAQALRFNTRVKSSMVVGVDFTSSPFVLTCDDGEKLQARSVIIATGAYARWLNCKGEEALRGHGVSACATCDGFFFRGQEVAVIGGGNTAAEEALFLTNHASKVYLIHRRDTLRAEKILTTRVLNHEKIEMIWNHTVDEMIGEGDPLALKALRLRSTDDKATEKILPVDGAFVAIGHLPATQVFKGHLDLHSNGYIKVEPGSTRTSVNGVFAAGDVADQLYRQAVTAAGLGCMAALDADKFIASL